MGLFVAAKPRDDVVEGRIRVQWRSGKDRNESIPLSHLVNPDVIGHGAR